jgi:hypothetical protein
MNSQRRSGWRREIIMRKTVFLLLMLLMLTGPAIFAIDNLKLKSKLDYTSDSLDGRLIAGDDAQCLQGH